MTESALVAEFRDLTRDMSVPQLRRGCTAYWKRHSTIAADVVEELTGLWTSSLAPDDNNIRMGIAMVLGPAAVGVDAAMEFMTGTIPDDDDWRVQESLAKGFDWYCAERGWKESVPVIEEWLGHQHQNVRRAAAEGPRVWTKRDYFADRPDEALHLLGELRSDPSPYVRRSVANALSDISKSHPDPTLAELRSWAGNPAAGWVATRACRHLVKSHTGEAERVIAAVTG